MQKHLKWTSEGVTVIEEGFCIETQMATTKETFIPIAKIYEVAENQNLAKRLNKLKQRFDSGTDGQGVAMIEVNRGTERRCFQVFCSWMPQWHIQHTDCSLDISYQDDGRGENRVVMLTTRKKYKTGLKFHTIIYGELELHNFKSGLDVRRLAENALAKMDSSNLNNHSEKEIEDAKDVYEEIRKRRKS